MSITHCRYCDETVLRFEVDDRGWCRKCVRAETLGGHSDAEDMRALLDRLESATTAGLRADDLEVSLIVEEWRAMKGKEAA